MIFFGKFKLRLGVYVVKHIDFTCLIEIIRCHLTASDVERFFLVCFVQLLILDQKLVALIQQINRKLLKELFEVFKGHRLVYFDFYISLQDILRLAQLNSQFEP